MADFQMPNVDGMNSMDELKNAVGKMAKELGWLLNNIDWKNINELNISLNDGASVVIANEGITVNDGTKNTFTVNTAGQVTMTGAKVQSSENGYPRVEMNPDQNLFGAYSAANNYLTIQALPGTAQSPQVVIAGPNSNMQMFISGLAAYLGATGAELNLSSNMDVSIRGRNINLTPDNGNYDVKVPFDQFKDTFTNQTLYAQLLGKARSGIQTGSSGSANGGIAPGTVLRTADGGTVTWTGISAHSHTQN
ncbi:hypothetical protein [Paenibacillus amylolyticus]|uniref:hypothetical protein n=1 Tax=Paenibacillus amylolyticus TaxID=1451 RepID=UPI000B8338EC|nr:hypothetical protein [Paenibacillus amylolyticus]